MNQIRRRQFLIATAALLGAPRIARAQALKRLPVLGILSPDRKPSPDVLAKSPFLNYKANSAPEGAGAGCAPPRLAERDD